MSKVKFKEKGDGDEVSGPSTPEVNFQDQIITQLEKLNLMMVNVEERIRSIENSSTNTSTDFNSPLPDQPSTDSPHGFKPSQDSTPK